MKKKLIIIAGPTASGKTSVSVELAKRINGEIISADSMQIYKHMDIGSAKVTEDEKQKIKHYLIDELDPGEGFNVQRFQQMAKAAIKKIYNKGKIPIIAGGTGFYIQSVVKDIDFTKTDEEEKIRSRVEEFYINNGKELLYQWLFEVDHESAMKIHANNVKRIKRYIEYFLLTGIKISEHNEKESKKESPYDVSFNVLYMERELLYNRINKRVEIMIESGLVNEVKKLKEMGYTKDMTSMQGLGYKEILDFLNEECSLEEAIYKIKRDTRHFAKRQLTWFKREDNVNWIPVDKLAFNKGHICDEIIKNIK